MCTLTKASETFSRHMQDGEHAFTSSFWAWEPRKRSAAAGAHPGMRIRAWALTQALACSLGTGYGPGWTLHEGSAGHAQRGRPEGSGRH